MKNLQFSISIFALSLVAALCSVDTALAQTGALTVSNNNLVFSSASTGLNAVPPQTVLLTNNSATAINFAVAVTSTGSWLNVSPTSGTLAANSSAQLLFSVNPTNAGALPGGNTYPANVTITGGSSTATVGATLAIDTTSGVPGGTGSVTFVPSPLVFNVAPGNAQNLSVTLTNTQSTPVTYSVSSNVNYLTLSPTQITVPQNSSATVSVTANSLGLTAGQYQGSITLTPVTAGIPVLTVPTSLNVGTAGLSVLASTCGSAAACPGLTFTFPADSTLPVTQQVTVTSSAGDVPFTAAGTVTTPSGTMPLTVNPPSPQTGLQGITLSVSVTPTGLPPGTYTGALTLTPTNGGSGISIPLTVSVGGAAAVTVTPSTLSFAYQTGTPITAVPVQTIAISSAGAAAAFFVTAATSSGGAWLVVNPTSGSTFGTGSAPTNLTVSVNPSGLTPGTYNGTITITPTASGTAQTVSVTLLVSSQPILSVSNGATTFNYQFGSTTIPSQQPVQLTSSGNPLNYTATVTPVSGGAFLNAITNATGSTPGTLQLSLNPSVLSTLAPGTYTSTVTISAPGAGNPSITYPVTLMVGNNTLLNASQNALNFNFQTGQSQPVPQTFTVSSTGSPLTFTAAAATTTCGNFLSVSPATGTTPGTVAVSVNSAGAPAGTCQGSITVSSGSAANTLTIPVNFYVSATALLNVSPSAINITTQVGTSPTSQAVALTSTDNSALAFNATATTSTGTGWLLVGPTSGSTPNNLSVGFNTAGLPVGTYTGSITITATGAGGAAVANAPVTVPVTVVVTSAAAATVTPSSLSFTQAFGGAAPATQTLTVDTGSSAGTFSASATTFNGNNWLSVQQTAGATPGMGTVTVTANGAGLSQGTYSGAVTILAPGTATPVINVPVTLTVTAAQTIAVAPAAVSFNVQSGNATAPAPQNVQVTSTGGSATFNAVATTATGGNWLTVTPATGTTGTAGAAVAIGLNQTVVSTLAPGTYTGTVTISSPQGPAVNQTVAVTLVIAAAPLPTTGAVVNAATQQAGPVAPGEIITIYGTNIGPGAPGIGFTLTPGGLVASNVGNTVVTFDGIPAPLTFVRNDQINLIVPYEIAGRTTTNLVIQRNGVSSASIALNVVPTVPGIFSANQTGNGQGSILNFDNSYNSATNPAARGSVVQIFATGEGQLALPGVPTGTVSSATTGKPIANVSVTIGGEPAVLQYAGEAPLEVAGLLQINAVVPTTIGTGPQTIVLTIGGANDKDTQKITVEVK